MIKQRNVMSTQRRERKKEKGTEKGKIYMKNNHSSCSMHCKNNRNML